MLEISFLTLKTFIFFEWCLQNRTFKHDICSSHVTIFFSTLVFNYQNKVNEYYSFLLHVIINYFYIHFIYVEEHEHRSMQYIVTFVSF